MLKVSGSCTAVGCIGLFPPLSATVIVTAYFRLIPRCRGTVRHQVCLSIVGYIRRGTQRFFRVHILWRKFVFHLSLVTHVCHVWYIPVLDHFDHLDRALLSPVIQNFRHWTVKDRRSIVRAATPLDPCGSGRIFCTVTAHLPWKAEL